MVKARIDKPQTDDGAFETRSCAAGAVSSDRKPNPHQMRGWPRSSKASPAPSKKISSGHGASGKPLCSNHWRKKAPRLAALNTKTARDRQFAQHHAGISGKHHVWQIGLRLDQRDFRMRGNRISEIIPLPDRESMIDAAAIAEHPRIDDVVHAKMIRRAHQNSLSGIGRGGGSGAILRHRRVCDMNIHATLVSAWGVAVFLKRVMEDLDRLQEIGLVDN